VVAVAGIGEPVREWVVEPEEAPVVTEPVPEPVEVPALVPS